MRLLGNLYIKKAYLDTWNSKIEGWLEEHSRIEFNVNLERNRLQAAIIEFNEEHGEDTLFHELEHYYIVKALLSIGVRLRNYFKLDQEFKHKMLSDYDPTLWH